MLIWSIRLYIILWGSERSFGRCGVVGWDVDIRGVWGEGRCCVMGCRLTAWEYVVAVRFVLYAPVVLGGFVVNVCPAV